MPTFSPRKLLFAATLATTAIANPASPLRTAAGGPACGNVNSKRSCPREQAAELTAAATAETAPATPSCAPAAPPTMLDVAAPIVAVAAPAAAPARRTALFAGLRTLMRASAAPGVAMVPLVTGSDRPACGNIMRKNSPPCPQVATTMDVP